MNRAQLEQWADEADQRYGFDPGQMRRLVQQESGWNPEAVSPAGARGLTQFMPATAREWGVNFSDPRSHIDRGAAYLAHLRDRYQGDMRTALAAYNWGMGNVETEGLENMPDETRRYLQATYAGPGIPMTPTAPPEPQPAPQGQGQLILAGPPQPAPGARDAFMAALQEQPSRSVGSRLADFAPAFMALALEGSPGAQKMMTLAMMDQRKAERDQRRAAREQRLTALYRAAFPEDTRTAQQKNIEYYAQNPQAFEMAKQLAAAQQPPSYGMTFDPRTGAAYQYSRTSPGVQQLTPGIDPAAQAAQKEAAEQRRVMTREAAKEYQELAPQVPGIEREIQGRQDVMSRLQDGSIALPPPSLLMRAIDPERGVVTNLAIENAPEEYREGIQAVGPIVLQEGARIARANNPTGPISDADAKAALQQAIGQLAADPQAFLQGSVNRGMDQLNRYQQLQQDLGMQPQQRQAPGMPPGAEIVPGSSVAQGGGTPLTPEDVQQLQGMTNQLLEAIEEL